VAARAVRADRGASRDHRVGRGHPHVRTAHPRQPGPHVLGALAPLLFTGALGLAAIGLRADGIHDGAARSLIIWGLLVAGIAYGGVQNLTLAQAFSAAGEPARATVSIVWNLSFDAGTGIGAFGTGAIATATS
jgi:hypothetical protein